MSYRDQHDGTSLLKYKQKQSTTRLVRLRTGKSLHLEPYCIMSTYTDIDGYQEDDDIEDVTQENKYDEKYLDTTIRYQGSDEVDPLDPRDVRNHKVNIITPVEMSISQLVKARTAARARKRSSTRDIDKEYLVEIFRPDKNEDMDDLDTLVDVLSKDEQRHFMSEDDNDEDEDESYISQDDSSYDEAKEYTTEDKKQ